jgi:hypothetical protein
MNATKYTPAEKMLLDDLLQTSEALALCIKALTVDPYGTSPVASAKRTLSRARAAIARATGQEGGAA